MANGLPQLNTGGINIVPGIEAGMRLKSLSQQNFLNQKKIAEYDTERDYLTKKRGWEEEDRVMEKRKAEFEIKVKALGAAVKLKDPAAASKFYESATGEKVDISTVGEDVDFTFGDGTKLKGPASKVYEVVEAISQDPTWMTDPEKAKKTLNYFKNAGISFTAPKKASLTEFEEKEKIKAKYNDGSDIKITDQELDAVALGIKNHPQYTQNQAQLLRDERMKTKESIARATASGKVEGVISKEDADRNADLVVRGLETFDYFKNVFGVSVQEQVRKAILRRDPDYNFLERRASVSGLMKSIDNQEKQRGMMGSFVSNINKQIDRVDEMAQNLSRIDVRILDMPKRTAVTKLKGSGFEKAYEAYLLEISNEIAKLSTGSSASIRELSTDAQERWANIHDPNLSLNQIKTILNETKRMAEMRLASTDEELQRTNKELGTRGVKIPGPVDEKTNSVSNMSDEDLLEELNK